MTLTRKTWLVLALALGLLAAIDLTISYRQLETASRNELTYDARTIYGYMMATRRIYQEQFVDSGLPVNDDTIGFLPAHSLQRIGQDFANWNDSGIVFNNVSDRPRNPANRADRFEQEAIEWFRDNPGETERFTEIQADDGSGSLLYTAPIRIEETCLKCHGKRDEAPPSIQQRYSQAYDYEVGDMRGVVSIRIPTSTVDERVNVIWSGMLAQRLVEYLAAFLVIGLVLNRLVVRRLSLLRDGAERLADGDYGARTARALAATPFHDDADEIGVLANTFDRMADAVQRRDRELNKLNQALDQSPTSILITDTDLKIEYVNRSITRTTGYHRDELIGKSPALFRSEKTPDSTYRALWQKLNQGKPWHGEFTNRRKDGAEFIESADIAPVFDDDGQVTHYLAVKLDITQQKQADAEIHRLAFYDPLTELPNRLLFHERLEQARSDGERDGTIGALLIIDLDNFKVLNDSKGHAVGDQLLQAISVRLGDGMRVDDTLARLGGDEYVVILQRLAQTDQPERASQQAGAIAESLLGMIRRPVQLDGIGGYQATASIGISLFSGTQQTTSNLLKAADVALYRAKKAGRDTVRFFDHEMQTEINARAAMENALRHALDNNELSLHLQPQVDVHGRWRGAEALLRWHLPDGRSISPMEFIPLAEETGLIVPIGAWVMASACALLREWSQQPQMRDLSLAVNVSARQFLQDDFAARVADCVARNGIDPSRLKIELTESVVLDGTDEVVARMHALKQLGLRFSLDDFGTGYSSLSYLKRLPLDEIKIDKSFVRDLAVDENDAAIVRAILAISESMHFRVVAEGVETEQQFAFLRAHDCRRFQGFLFARPIPADQWAARFPGIADERATGHQGLG
ncbi:MAG: EAL domain-containing protein [Gammaproteobacteria bacterium]|nr:EAL domain-containing protein [Gammaproteobacteria bacterium]